MPLVFNHIALTLNKFCKWDATVPYVCKPLTNNLAESVNHKIKTFVVFKKEIPTKVINSLKDLTDLQLNYIGLMFK